MEKRQQAPTQKSVVFRAKTGTAVLEDERTVFILLLVLVKFEDCPRLALNNPSETFSKLTITVTELFQNDN
jgi:hypothetical protein